MALKLKMRDCRALGVGREMPKRVAREFEGWVDCESASLTWVSAFFCCRMSHSWTVGWPQMTAA